MAEWSSPRSKRRARKAARDSSSLNARIPLDGPARLPIHQHNTQGRFAALTPDPLHAPSAKSATGISPFIAPRAWPSRQTRSQSPLKSNKESSPSRSPIKRFAPRPTPPVAAKKYEMSLVLPNAFEYGNYVRGLERDTHTEIVLDHGQGKRPSYVKIWGSHAEAHNALSTLENWLKDKSNTQSLHTYPRVQSMTRDLRDRENESNDIRDDLVFFRSMPESTVMYDTNSIFQWPSNDHRPEDMLGPNLEKLDAIRREYKCHIVADNNLGVLRIVGSSPDVESALLRIRNIFLHLKAQNPTSSQASIVYWPGSMVKARHVMLCQMGNQQHVSVRGDDLAASLVLVDTAYERKIQKVVAHIQEGLEKAKMLIGNIFFSIRLGPLVLETYRQKDVYLVEEFEEMMSEPSFEAHAHSDLSRVLQKDAEAFAEVSFQSRLRAESMQKGSPDLVVTISIHDTAGNIRLTGIFQTDPSNKLELPDRISIDCERLRKSNSQYAPKQLLNVDLVDLSTGLAWNFGMNATQAESESRMPRTIQDYIAFYFRIKSKPSLADRELWLPLTGLSGVRSVRQEVKYKYRMEGSDYTLSISEYRDYEIGSGNAVGAVSPQALSIMVDRPEWETVFAANRELKIGERADWESNSAEHFPVTAATLKALLASLDTVADAAAQPRRTDVAK